MPSSKKTKKSTPKLTQKQKQYDEQLNYWRKRLKRKVRDISKRGFTFPEDFIPEKPERRLAKYIEELKNKVENIYESAYYVEQATGEFVEGTARRKAERVKAAEKAAETKRRNRQFWEDSEYPIAPEPPKPPTPEVEPPTSNLPSEIVNIIQDVYKEIETWTPPPKWSAELGDIKREDVNLLQSVLDGAIASQGIEQVALNLSEHTKEFKELCTEVLFNSGSKYQEDGREGMRKKINKIATFVWGRPLTVAESKILTDAAESMNEYS